MVMMDDAAEQAAATTAGQIAQAKTKVPHLSPIPI